MNDQKTMWNQKHSAPVDPVQIAQPNEFAQQVGTQLAVGQKLLELGCGRGTDARYFASLGMQVRATDFSEVVIEQERAATKEPNPQFAVLDISQPFPYKPGSFDVVYAHLSLHYYNQEDTKKIFAEIARVLKDGGKLYFSCKSNHDPLYGQGNEVQPGVFDLDGHIRHFFSIDYTRDLVADHFEVIKIEDAEGVYWGSSSAFVHCWATKK